MGSQRHTSHGDKPIPCPGRVFREEEYWLDSIKLSPRNREPRALDCGVSPSEIGSFAAGSRFICSSGWFEKRVSTPLYARNKKTYRFGAIISIASMLLKTRIEQMSETGLSIIYMKTMYIEDALHYIYERKAGYVFGIMRSPQLERRGLTSKTQPVEQRFGSVFGAWTAGVVAHRERTLEVIELLRLPTGILSTLGRSTDAEVSAGRLTRVRWREAHETGMAMELEPRSPFLTLRTSADKMN